ncbi:hypothetical protein LCGC14_1854030 [marine sediment metagenome]|uniref:Uncharacterized protein n=1 Tax=marine sediment metagenome TaxID=412755 RepID=A0A0F9G9Y1_9ZZZZ
MAWFCKGCGERRGGAMCKKWCRERYGDVGAERIPPLDGMIFFNDDGSGIPRWEIRAQENCPVRYVPKSVAGPRPQGWGEALERMEERAAVLLATGMEVPEC